MFEDKKRCVWMTSGIISYKLCARDYQCDYCVFDYAMRNDAADLRQNNNSFHIADDNFYHRGHCWLKVENTDCVRLGINGILAGLINNIKTIVLPQPGEIINPDQSICHIIQQRHILPLRSPLKGLIVSVNSELEKNPELITKNYWDKGWLITLKPENLEHDLRSMFFGKEAVEWHKNKERKMIEICTSLLYKNENDLKPTLQDGGEMMPDFTGILNSEQYYQLLEILLQPEENN